LGLAKFKLGCCVKDKWKFVKMLIVKSLLSLVRCLPLVLGFSLVCGQALAAKAVAKPSNSAVKAIDYVMGKKWSNGIFPCDWKGGSYRVWNRSSGSGFEWFFEGKRNPGPPATAVPEFKDLSPSQFQYSWRVYPTSEQAEILGIPVSTVVGELTQLVTLIGPTRIHYKQNYRELDGQAIVKGVIRYTEIPEDTDSEFCK
jgi:hypothetical protein